MNKDKAKKAHLWDDEPIASIHQECIASSQTQSTPRQSLNENISSTDSVVEVNNELDTS